MPTEKMVFLDFDDTLSDPFVLTGQYCDRIGEILTAEYGGDPREWARASIDTMVALEKEYIDRFTKNARNGYCAWLEDVQTRSVVELFDRMGLNAPANTVQVARQTQFLALSSCDATFPGAREALAALRKSGYQIHAASGQESRYLFAALTGAGLIEYVDRLYGPDLIDCAKEGPEYFACLFADLGIPPAEALIVDDQPFVIAWALEHGVTVIQSQQSPERHFPVAEGVSAVLTDLYSLPMLVDLHHPNR